MFRKIPDNELKKFGSAKQLEFDIQGLPCFTPPVGWIYNHLDDQWEKTGVYKRAHNVADCYWEKDERFKQYKTWEAEQERRRQATPDYEHPELQIFIRDCWIKRLGGMWLSINGEAVYLTGQHWLYLSCYSFDGEKVKYRQIDRDLFYAWKYCEEDPDCFGLNLVTKRRNGKTAIGALIAIDYATRIPYFHAGIQSKTDKDAKDVVYKKAVVSPYRKFPSFFQPVSNLPKGGDVPASGLFFNSGKMGSEDDELESIIDFRSSNISAYDGTKLGYWFDDEPGKTILCDVYERWNVVKYCLLDDESRIIGKSFHATTVEEMESGGEEFFDMWVDSDQSKKEDGRTISGLFQYFIPSYQTRKIDKYGKCDEEANRQQILRERKRLASKPRELASAIRKEPFDIKEAFQIDSQTCRFNPLMINEQIEAIRWIPEQFKRGNFHWKDGIRFTEVMFVENPNGRVMMVYNPPEEQRNQVFERGNKWFPGNIASFCAGADPYDHRQLTKDSKRQMSMASFTIRKKPDPVNPHPLDYGIACGYLDRPNTPNVFYEDCLMALWYYGCYGLVETNKPGLMHYLEDSDCDGFVPYLDSTATKRGVNASAEMNNLIADLTENFLDQHIKTVLIMVYLEQWLRFSPEETTKFDAAMSFGYSEILMKNSISKNKKKEKRMDVFNLLPSVFLGSKSIQKNEH